MVNGELDMGRALLGGRVKIDASPATCCAFANSSDPSSRPLLHSGRSRLAASATLATHPGADPCHAPGWAIATRDPPVSPRATRGPHARISQHTHQDPHAACRVRALAPRDAGPSTEAHGMRRAA